MKYKYWFYKHILRRNYVVGVDFSEGKDKDMYVVVRYKKGGEREVVECFENLCESYPLPKDFMVLAEKLNHPPHIRGGINI